MALPIGKIAAGMLVIVVAFGGAFWVMHAMSPGAQTGGPPLPRCRRSSRSRARR